MVSVFLSESECTSKEADLNGNSILLAQINDSVCLGSSNTIPLHYLYNKHKQQRLLQFVDLSNKILLFLKACLQH